MAKRMTCEGGYTERDAKAEVSKLKRKGRTAKAKRVKVRGGHEYKVCWRRR
jgi:hypothetical protein